MHLSDIDVGIKIRKYLLFVAGIHLEAIRKTPMAIVFLDFISFSFHTHVGSNES